MLIYKNIHGEQEAVAKKMVVRFSRKEDLTTNFAKRITFIHLSNNEQIKSLDDIESLVKQMIQQNNIDLKRRNHGNKEK